MRFLFTALFIQLKRFLRHGSTYICLLLPLFIVALGLLLPPSEQKPDILEVGIYYSKTADNLGLAQKLLQELQNEPYSSNGTEDPLPIYFVQAGSIEELNANVAAGRWECGYLLPDNFDSRILAGEYRDLITCVTSPATSLATLIDDAVAGALLNVSSPYIARSYLTHTGLIDPGSAEGQISTVEAAYFVSQQPLSLEIELVKVPEQAADNPVIILSMGAFLRGIVALLLFLFACLSLVRFGDDLRSVFFGRMNSYRGFVSLFLPPFAATGIISIVSGYISLLLANLFFPGTFQGFFLELGWLVLYQVYLFAIILLFACIFHNKDLVLSFTPFLMIACFVFCPILFDLSSFLPAAGYLSLILPPTLYLKAAASDSNMLWLMATLSLVLIILGTAILMGQGRSKAMQRRGAEN